MESLSPSAVHVKTRSSDRSTVATGYVLGSSRYRVGACTEAVNAGTSPPDASTVTVPPEGHGSSIPRGGSVTQVCSYDESSRGLAVSGMASPPTVRTPAEVKVIGGGSDVAGPTTSQRQ